MRLQRVTIIGFLLYVLVTGCITSVFTLLANREVNPVTREEREAKRPSVLQAVGDAFSGLGDALGLWVQFIASCLFLVLLFYIFLKLTLQLSVRKVVLYTIITYSISFLIYLLLHSLLQWLFGFYFSIAIVIIVTTYFLLRWEQLFKLQSSE